MSQIPEGYKRDARGNLVAIENIKPVDLLRDELVNDLIEGAHVAQMGLQSFKAFSRSQVSEFVELSAAEYNVQLGGRKGNISLVTIDGCRKIQLQVSEHIQFDERLQVAKQLIDACIHDWSDGANDRIRTLVEHAFQVDKQGQVSIGRILGLRKLDMDDERWEQAMQAIADSIQVTGSKEYIRFYERATSNDAWRPISLDIAAI